MMIILLLLISTNRSIDRISSAVQATFQGKEKHSAVHISFLPLKQPNTWGQASGKITTAHNKLH